MQVTHWVVAVFVDEFMDSDVIWMKLRTRVIPTYYMLTSWRGRERERERKRERDSMTFLCTLI